MRDEAREGVSVDIAMIGLGKMGANMTRRLLKGGHTVHAFDRDAERVAKPERDGAKKLASVARLYFFLRHEPPG